MTSRRINLTQNPSYPTPMTAIAAHPDPVQHWAALHGSVPLHTPDSRISHSLSGGS